MFGFCPLPPPQISPHIRPTTAVLNPGWGTFKCLSPVGPQASRCFWCVPGLTHTALYSGTSVVETDNCHHLPPKSLGCFLPGPWSRTRASTGCLSRSKGVSWGPVWPCLQVAPKTARKQGPDTASWHALSQHQLRIKHQLCCPCQMPTEMMWVKPLSSVHRENTLIFVIYSIWMPFHLSSQDTCLERPILVVSSCILYLYPCTPPLSYKAQEGPFTFMWVVLSQWFLKCGILQGAGEWAVSTMSITWGIC